MSAYDVVAFNGTNLGTGTDYDAWLDSRDEYVMAGTINAEERRSASMLVTGTSEDGRTITLHIANAPGSSLTSAEFRDAVKRLFDPRLNYRGERALVIVGDDGSTNVQIGVYVAQIGYLSQGIDQYAITLWAPRNYWQATSVTTSASNPATVDNDGNTIAYPTIELTTSTHVTRRACTVVDAAMATGGFVAYPILFTLNSTAATNTNTFVYVEGVSVPCWVGNSGLNSSYVWALVDVAHGGTTNVDVIYGTGLTNPLCQTLDDGGQDFADTTNNNNGTWEWNDWSVSSFPARPGTWRPALTGNHSEAADATYQITTENSTNVVISLGAAGAYDNSADSIRLQVGAKADTTNALANLSRVTANLDGTNARAYVRYRVAGSNSWLDAWTATTNATVTTAIDLDNAVEIAVGLENFGTTADPATLTISGTTTKLTILGEPTVTVGTASNMDLYDGVYEIEDADGNTRSITFTDFIVPDGTLTIDCENRTITSSVAGPFYGGEEALVFDNPDQWLALSPGTSTITDGLGATDVVKHQHAYV